MELDLLRQVERSRKKGSRQRWISLEVIYLYLCLCLCLYLCLYLYLYLCLYLCLCLYVRREPDKGGIVLYFRNVKDSIAIVGITEALIIGEFFDISTLGKYFTQILSIVCFGGKSNRVTSERCGCLIPLFSFE